MQTPSWLKAALVSALGCFLALIGLIWGLTLLSKVRAEAFLKDFGTLIPGKSSFAEAQQFAKIYSGRPSNIASEETACSEQDCGLSFAFANKPLSYLPGIRTVSLGGHITIKGGRVAECALVYQATAPVPDVHDPQLGDVLPVPEPQYLYGVIDTLDRDEKEYGPKKSDVDQQGVPHFFMFRLGPLSTPEARKNAYGLDLSCLARWRNCGAASDFYPRGWQSW